MPKRKTPKRRGPRKKYVFETRYFVQSTDADRSITGFGRCSKGVWVEVPKRVYLAIKNAIAEGKKVGETVGWTVKTERQRLEV